MKTLMFIPQPPPTFLYMLCRIVQCLYSDLATEDVTKKCWHVGNLFFMLRVQKEVVNFCRRSLFTIIKSLKWDLQKMRLKTGSLKPKLTDWSATSEINYRQKGIYHTLNLFLWGLEGVDIDTNCTHSWKKQKKPEIGECFA